MDANARIASVGHGGSYESGLSETAVITADALDGVIEALTEGALIIVPTRRWYMLCALSTFKDTARRIFAAKARPRSKGLMLAVRDKRAATEICALSPAALALADSFWPGDLLIRARWRNRCAVYMGDGVDESSVLVGVPDGVMHQLVLRLNAPLLAASANISTEAMLSTPPAISVNECLAFTAVSSEKIALIVDGGIAPLCEHATIVDATSSNVVIERHGVIHERAIVTALEYSINPNIQS